MREMYIMALSVLLAGSLVAGCSSAFRLLGERPGFRLGVVVCFIPIILCSVMGAYFTGGWGETLLGTRWGALIGVYLGAYVLSFILTLTCGFIGWRIHNIKGTHQAKPGTPHDTMERNVNSNEEHSRRP